MKTLGIIRKIDTLGRIVIPMEMRNKLKISFNEPVEIHMEGNQVILKKYEPDCVFCSSQKDVSEYKGKNVCKKCIEELSKKV